MNGDVDDPMCGADVFGGGGGRGCGCGGSPGSSKK